MARLGGISTASDVYVTTGPLVAKVVTKTANYTAADECVILCDATSASFTITLPAAAGVTGRVYHIKKIAGSDMKVITVDGNSSETIDGQTTQTISSLYDSLMIVCDGSNWYIL